MDTRPLSKLLKALADPTRLRIVALLAHGELCVCHLEKGLGLLQTTASRHLGVLRAAGVVEARREKSWVYYRLASQRDALGKRVMGEIVGGFAEKGALRRDVAKLVKAMGPGSCR